MFFLLQIIITIVILLLSIFPFIYLVIGIKLLIISKKEHSRFKEKNGWISLLTATAVILVLLLFWWKIVSYFDFPYENY
jgi:hypothetical protein